MKVNSHIPKGGCRVPHYDTMGNGAEYSIGFATIFKARNNERLILSIPGSLQVCFPVG